jgi:IS1 family transposase
VEIPVVNYGNQFLRRIEQSIAPPIFWAAYQAAIPEEQHTAVGKETGQTAHVERWKNTLRQRLARARSENSFFLKISHYA